MTSKRGNQAVIFFPSLCSLCSAAAHGTARCSALLFISFQASSEPQACKWLCRQGQGWSTTTTELFALTASDPPLTKGLLTSKVITWVTVILLTWTSPMFCWISLSCPDKLLSVSCEPERSCLNSWVESAVGTVSKPSVKLLCKLDVSESWAVSVLFCLLQTVEYFF